MDANSTRDVNDALEQKIQALSVKMLRDFIAFGRVDNRTRSEPLYRRALKNFLEITNSDFGFIGDIKFDENGVSYLKTRACSNIAWNDESAKAFSSAGMEFRNHDTLFGQVMATESLVVANDPATDPRSGGVPSGHPTLRNFFGLPLILNGSMIGMVGLANSPQGYPDELVTSLNPLVDTLAALLWGTLASTELARGAASKRASFDNAPYLFLEVTEEHGDVQIVGCNPAFLRATGYQLGDLTGRNLSDVMPNAGSLNARFSAHQAMADPIGSPGFSSALMLDDGTSIQVDASITRDATALSPGKTMRIVIYPDELEPAFQSQAQLAASELRKFLETGNAAILGTDTAGLINEWTPYLEEAVGFSREDACGRTLESLLADPSDKAELAHVLLAVSAGSDRSGVIMKLAGKDSDTREILLNLAPRKDIEGKIVGILGIGQDITALSKANAEKEHAANEFLDFIEQTVYPVVGTDTDGVINVFNAAAERVAGLTKSEAIGRKGIFPERIIRLLRDTLNGAVTEPVEVVLDVSGIKKSVIASASQRYDAEGNISGALIVGHDLTEILEKEEAIQRAQKMEAIGQLTGGIAHDFNNLLTVIQGNINLLKEEIPDLHEDTQEILEDALSAAKEGSNLTKQLLAFARKQPLVAGDVNLNELVSKLVRMVNRTIGDSIEIATELEPADLLIHVDSSQLESALLNLCINARDAMGSKGGVITLSTGVTRVERSSGPPTLLRPGAYAEIRVKDEGVGMSTEIMERVFDPFFTTKGAGEGSGLGLSMVQGFAHQSKGEVIIQSEVGKGACVSLLMPLSDSTAMKGSAIEEDTEYTSSEHRGLVLIVEDEARVRKFAVRCLEKAGFDVLECESGPQALAVLEENDAVDVVFSDIMMPGGMTGRELARVIADRYPGLPIRLATGFERVKVDDSVTSGVVKQDASVLRKPYTRGELLSCIESALN